MRGGAAIGRGEEVLDDRHEHGRRHRDEGDTAIHEGDLLSISSTGLADGFGRWSCPTAAGLRRIHPMKWVPGSRDPLGAFGIRRRLAAPSPEGQVADR